MTEDDPSIANGHFGDLLYPDELVRHSLNDAIVIPQDEVDLPAADSFAVRQSHMRATDAKIGEEAKVILCLHTIVHAREDFLVHFRSTREWSLAVADDI